MNKIDFGFIAEDFCLDGDFPIEIYEKPTQETLDFLKKNDYYIYAEHKHRLLTIKNNSTMHNVKSLEHGKFMVQCFSFFYGQKLTTMKCEGVDSVKIKSGGLGLYISKENMQIFLTLCDNLWEKLEKNSKTGQRQKKRIFNIIHLLFMSKSRKLLQFEKFIYLYIALDACFAQFESAGKVRKKYKIAYGEKIERKCTHKERLQEIEHIIGTNFSKTYNLDIFYKYRNDLFHEGIYLDEPLGYKAIGGEKNLTFVEIFLIQAIFSVLEIPATGFLSTDSLNQTEVTFQDTSIVSS